MGSSSWLGELRPSLITETYCSSQISSSQRRSPSLNPSGSHRYTTIFSARHRILTKKNTIDKNIERLLRAIDLYEVLRLDFAEAHLVAIAGSIGSTPIAFFDPSIERVPGDLRFEPARPPEPATESLNTERGEHSEGDAGPLQHGIGGSLLNHRRFVASTLHNRNRLTSIWRRRWRYRRWRSRVGRPSQPV